MSQNPFLNASMEENTLDANDNNPLLKAEDPAKQAEEDGAKMADDYEYVESEAVEGENQKPDEAIIQGEESELVGKLDNIVEESANGGAVVQALASVAQEMMQIIATNGKLSPTEMLLVNHTVSSCEKLVPSLRNPNVAMPSMEDFKMVGMQYTCSQVSLEGVMDKVKTAINNLGLNIERLFENGIGLARSMTPIIDSQIARITKLRSQLNGAHRDAGQKELSGKFVKTLSIEGRAPDAATVVKTAAYLNQVTSEILAPSIQQGAVNYVKAAQAVIREAMHAEKLKSPSALLATIIKMFMPANNLGGALSAAHDDYLRDKVGKQVRIDGKVAPELFKLFPSVAKVRDVNTDEDFLEAMRSLSLFNNKVISVLQYKKEVTADLRMHMTPTLKLTSLGKGYGKTMQALTAAQQGDVLDSALAILQNARGYFKDYASRNRACMTVWQSAYQDVLKMENSKQGMIARQMCIEFIRMYTRIYWEGIFDHQAKISIYARRVTSALVDLVEASLGAAQGGSPSQEAIALAAEVEEQKNPFM